MRPPCADKFDSRAVPANILRPNWAFHAVMMIRTANSSLLLLAQTSGAVASFKSKLEKKAFGPDRVRVSP